MGQDTEQLKREIETTRADMGATLDAIGDRVSPGRVVERKKNKLVLTGRSLKDRVMGVAGDAPSHIAHTAESARDAVAGAATQATDAARQTSDAVIHRTEGAPMVAGAIAFGAGFLLAASLPASQAEVDASARLVESLEPVKEDLSDTAREIAEHLKEPAMEAAQNVKDAASDGAHAVTSTAREAVEETAQHARDSVAAVKDGDTQVS
jgi:ElaB/YqjD/DUF883 family membrane-anchored ribosome-binding protein